MNITCIICSDTIVPSDVIFATPCGHLFHHACLIQWVERSKTCPQCRNKATESSIHRIYFTVSNTDHIVDDVATLQSKIDNIRFQMTLKEKDVKNLTDKYKKVKSQNIVLREEISELENKVRVNDSVVHALKDQVSFLRSKSKERDRLVEEIAKLKSKLKNLESVETAINGTREEFNDILRSDNDPDSLIILAATLKKALLDAEKKKSSAEHRFKQLQTEVAKNRSEVSSLQLSNDELRKEIELLKTNWSQEKDYLKNMVLDVHQRRSDKHNSSLKRIITESPVPLYKNNLGIKDNETSTFNAKSPSLEEKVSNILESNSPYLPVKSSMMNIDYQSQKNETPRQTSSKTKEISIFKKPTKELRTISSHSEIVSNGLGGHNKRDIFPSSRMSHTGFKRQMTISGSSSSKSRKLNSMSFVKNNIL